jgi:hypothetical protein
MYRGFYINLDDFNETYRDEFTGYGENGQKTLLDFKEKIETTLEPYELPYIPDDNRVLDGQKILDDWFPVSEVPRFHAFLSHSHQDIELTNKFAGWLYKHFKIESFIDSTIWNHSFPLKEQIYNKYRMSSNTESTNYKLICESSAYVDNMLLTSLNLMMNSCEVIFFLESKNSISDKTPNKSVTTSPWIFSELNFTRTLQKRKNISPICESFGSSEKSLKIELTAHLDNLKKLQTSDLKKWIEYSKKRNCNNDPEKCLDILYQQHKPEKY